MAWALITITLWPSPPPHDQVGDVPEFRAGRQKLRALEDRLQVRGDSHLEGVGVPPPLTLGFTNHHALMSPCDPL